MGRLRIRREWATSRAAVRARRGRIRCAVPARARRRAEAGTGSPRGDPEPYATKARPTPRPRRFHRESESLRKPISMAPIKPLLLIAAALLLAAAPAPAEDGRGEQIFELCVQCQEHIGVLCVGSQVDVLVRIGREHAQRNA